MADDPRPSNKLHITLAEIAARLRVGKKTIRKWIKDRNLPVAKLGQIYTTENALIDWIEEQIKKPPEGGS